MDVEQILIGHSTDKYVCYLWPYTQNAITLCYV